jgi:exopolyphosphatase/pppGpp-phosphohydrolase
LEDLLRSLCRLRLLRIGESLNQLRFLQQEIQEQGENSLKPYQDLVLQYSQDRDRLDKLIRQPLQLD